jgi:diaminopimelate epimerase
VSSRPGFGKAHGLGNDFLLVDVAAAPPLERRSAWGRRLCDRHIGIGADGVLVYSVGRDRVEMRLTNADGSDGDLSANGVRCLAAWCVERGWLGESHVVETPPGPRPVRVEARGPGRYRVRSDLGRPRLARAVVPIALHPPREPVTDLEIVVGGERLRVTATSMGNPHCTLLLDEVAADALIARLGPVLENHPLFPRRTNVEFATPLSRDRLRVRFWERGVGPTRASGTGSSAASVAAMLAGRVDRRVTAVCDGGDLEIEWPEGGALVQTGEVEILFAGEWLGPDPAQAEA